MIGIWSVDDFILILKKDDTSERYININLKVGLEIPGGEAIYFDEDTFKLIFLNIEQDLEWLDAHLAYLNFKKKWKNWNRFWSWAIKFTTSRYERRETNHYPHW